MEIWESPISLQNLIVWFNFFISVPDDPETEVDEEIDNLLTTDFEIGHYIRERIIPRAVLYFTGMTLQVLFFDAKLLIIKYIIR